MRPETLNVCEVCELPHEGRVIDVYEGGVWTREVLDCTVHYDCPECTEGYGDGELVYHRKDV